MNSTVLSPRDLESLHFEKRYFQTDNRFIVLDDLTAGYHHPSVIDFKLGTLQYTDTTSGEMRRWRKVKADATTSATLGYRLGGIRAYKPAAGKWMTRKSRYGKRLTESTMHDALHFYLNDGKRTRVEIIPKVVERLRGVLRAVEQQRAFDFVASSVLIIYESSPPIDKLHFCKPDPSPRVDVKLIDFDHAIILADFPNHSGNAGAAIGLRNLIKVCVSMPFFKFIRWCIHYSSLAHFLSCRYLRRISSRRHARTATPICPRT